jgi:aspartate--ammonia ligase
MENNLIVPENYKPELNLRETELAIKQIKDRVESQLADTLNLTRVSAPLFVRKETGLNDDLNGVERPVSFDIKELGSNVEIVHSLAKWKRMALDRYDFYPGEGIYTDMNAIRRDELLDNLHSVYVDQWDWEKIIREDQRSIDYLKYAVGEIYACLRRVENYVSREYSCMIRKLPEEIFFITTAELLEKYPNLSAREREDAICFEKKAVFIIGIGKELADGKPHDGRAPDYDDWDLNGDLLFWYPLLERAFEISSMGIRVDKDSMRRQLEASGCLERENYDFHKNVLAGKLPYTIGGGIGQSRLCMFFLDKAHIGEVQSSVWPDDMIAACEQNSIQLL